MILLQNGTKGTCIIAGMLTVPEAVNVDFFVVKWQLKVLSNYEYPVQNV